jgi:small conductance mechanosensitive channel
MRFIASLLISLCLLIPVLPEPASAQDGTITAKTGALEDAAIATRIRDIKDELHGYDDVTVVVNAGIVTLRGETVDKASSARLVELATRVEGVVAVESAISETTDLSERLAPVLDRFEARMVQAVAMLPLLLVAGIAFMLVTIVGFLIAGLKQPWNRLAPNPFIADIFRTVLRIAAVIAGIVVALDLLGATALLGTILGAAGILGLAISFAVKDTVENFIASVMLSIRQPFRPNDTIEIGGDTGKVIRLTSRATILLSFDGNQIRIPNATVFKSRIVNYSRNPERRFSFDAGLSYQADIAQARTIAEETLAALPFTLNEPAPSTWIEEMGDSAITLRCTAWVDQNETSFSMARSEAIRMVKAAIEAANFAAPEPTFRIITSQASDEAPQASTKPMKRSSKSSTPSGAMPTPPIS